MLYKSSFGERLINVYRMIGVMSSNQFNSVTYKGFVTWQKVIFWIGILSFIHPAYWIVRLILYLVVKKEPLKKRVGFYAMQTYVFGWIAAVVLALLIIVLTVLLIVAGFAMLWLVPVSSTVSP